MKSFSLYSGFRRIGFSKTEKLVKQLSFAIMYITYSLFLCKSYFMRTKALILAKKKKKEQAKKKVRLTVPQNIRRK